MSTSRLILSSKGQEIQSQIRDVLKKEQLASMNAAKSQSDLDGNPCSPQILAENSFDYKQLLQGAPNAQDQMQHYSDFVIRQLNDPAKIRNYLKTKVVDSKQIKVPLSHSHSPRPNSSTAKSTRQPRPYTRTPRTTSTFPSPSPSSTSDRAST